MIFRICAADEQLIYGRSIVRLVCDDWADGGLYSSFTASYFDDWGREYPLGPVKIGKKGITSGRISQMLFREFAALSEDFFSLGQDETYYENIAHLGIQLRQEILTSLRDVALDLEHLERCRQEPAMYRSLLRSYSSGDSLHDADAASEVALFTVRGQLHRMTEGGARLTDYSFTYTLPRSGQSASDLCLKFEVTTGTKPPTNIHALIGRNGSGKTHLIRSMIRCIQSGRSEFGRFDYHSGKSQNTGTEFANILCIAFSPFDDFSSLGKEESFVPWAYVGLDKHSSDLRKSIADQFWTSFTNCLLAQRKQKLWLEAIEVLKSDPIFEEEQIHRFMTDLKGRRKEEITSEQKNAIMDVFDRLSSGHKVVLLTITSCVEKIEERSIVFVDEPENHLHPPLLAAMIRALSDLLKDRNAVAIVSTHSPVVLQELPSTCVWVLNRRHNTMKAEQLDIQTFGSTISLLTQKVFRLEVQRSGFHKLLSEAVTQQDTYDSFERIEAEFGHQLGDQAQMLLRTMLMLNEQGVD